MSRIFSHAASALAHNLTHILQLPPPHELSGGGESLDPNFRNPRREPLLHPQAACSKAHIHHSCFRKVLDQQCQNFPALCRLSFHHDLLPLPPLLFLTGLSGTESALVSFLSCGTAYPPPLAVCTCQHLSLQGLLLP